MAERRFQRKSARLEARIPLQVYELMQRAARLWMKSAFARRFSICLTVIDRRRRELGAVHGRSCRNEHKSSRMSTALVFKSGA